MLPVLRRKGAAVFRAEGLKNAFLVESLQGVRTVKSLALDTRRRHEWDVRVAEAVRLNLDELQHGQRHPDRRYSARTVDGERCVCTRRLSCDLDQ